MQGRSLKDFFSRDRKTLYMILGIVLVSIFSLTIVYAALSVTLNITGNAEVVASSWNVHLDNVKVTSGSVSGTDPSITNGTTASFSTTLTTPGDFYEFTIDVVNGGSIDAMIDGITKTPTLSTAQAKYLNYIVEYQNGESINTKQLVAKNSFVRLKVRLEYRKDLVASDLPTTSETLNLAFTVNYVQSDGSASSVTDNGVKKIYEVVNGDLNTVGSEICIGEECFYLMKNNGSSVTMLAKYNLDVGSIVSKGGDGTIGINSIENPTGIQSFNALGGQVDEEYNPINFPWYGTMTYSSTIYWFDIANENFNSSFPVDVEVDEFALPYIYNSDSLLYAPVENYKTYLESQGANIEEARLMKFSELLELGCNLEDLNCFSAPEWVYGTSYWIGVAAGYDLVLSVRFGVGLYSDMYNHPSLYGVRPVINLTL